MRAILALLCLLAGVRPAAAYVPLTDFKRLRAPQGQKVVRVKTARVLIADYDLLRADFPELHGKSTLEIDAWLLEQGAYLGIEQASQHGVNSVIDAESAPGVHAYRPQNYGRALVFRVRRPQGWRRRYLDSKGSGARRPRQSDHSNGLCTLGEVTREYLEEKLISMISRKARLGIDTVGSYAILDWGFDVVFPDGSVQRAGAIFRQAHDRNWHEEFDDDFLPDDVALSIERKLRLFGITSAGAYRQFAGESMNIQGTSSGALVDFGGFLVVRRFRKPVYRFHDVDENGRVESGTEPALAPGTPEFVQPNPLVRVPFNLWGYGATGKEDPSFDNPAVWSHQFAESLGAGRATRADLGQHLRNFLGPVAERLDTACRRSLLPL